MRKAVIGAIVLMLIAIVAVDVFVLFRRARYENEITRLREGMSDVERERADLVLVSKERRTQVIMELMRRQARADDDLHLAIAVDSGTMHLQRSGERLRDMKVEIAAAGMIGSGSDTVQLAVPLGTRTIEKLLTARDKWKLPAVVYRDRDDPQGSDAAVAGVLGPYAIVLSGGTIIYSLPGSGPLADSTYVLPGAIRASAEDLKAIFANLRVGTRVYLY